MPDTDIFSWTMPTVGGSGGAWGTELNALFDNDIEGTVAANTINRSRARVSKSAVQSISQNVNTVLTWDQEDFDVDALHDNATNNSRLTVPAGGAGLWLVGAQVDWAPTSAATTGDLFRVELLKNGTTIPGAAITAFASDTVFELRMPVSVIDTAADADYYEVQVRQGVQTLDVNTGSRFWAVKLA